MTVKKQVHRKDNARATRQQARRVDEERLLAGEPRADLNPDSLTARDVMQLERLVGNQAARHLLQAKAEAPVQRQEPVMQRMGTYPDRFQDKTGQLIDEIAYGTGRQITFGTMTSCLGIVARKGDTVTGIHLGMFSGEDPISSFDSDEIVESIKGIIGSGPEKVVFVGFPHSWRGQFGGFYSALTKAYPPNAVVDNDGDNYVAGVKDGLLHILLDNKEVYTEAPAEPVPAPARRRRCFITTACVEAMGLPDDCHELTTLRAFRDGYMSALPDGPALIAEYYRIAPQIVARIQAQPDASAILTGLYDRIVESVDCVQQGDDAKAMQVYSAMVLQLKRRFLDAG